MNTLIFIFIIIIFKEMFPLVNYFIFIMCIMIYDIILSYLRSI